MSAEVVCIASFNADLVSRVARPIARGDGYTVDISGFETALSRQRALSQDERKSKKLSVAADELASVARPIPGWG